MNVVSPTELAARLRSQKPPQLLDVREAAEREIVSLPGSRWIPLSELATRSAELDDWVGTEVVVYCHHGIRSARGASILESLGFSKIANLAGGIDRWSVEVDPGAARY